ncbi:AfsR/SARP family transcriptional regulator [Crossiella cryophila]|uniref:DNA-binding SARP family transcriptional activator n=1 Tax=Crossiella cryophila TaxID=43355 RepID=A0A7W7C3Z0_9PSEU|nr:BTAD domain-containing putative transcriptional regulator [Crossiella cryophila]MBB4674054.1 DNA-binding SARP family transcriptional activator [Crossiella cryophila]
MEIWASGLPKEQPPPRARQILALLLLNPGVITSTDRLIDAVWGEAPPPNARKALQVHISHLRQLLAVPLRHSPPGYVLSVRPEQVDLHRFRAWTAAARRESDPEQAGILLRRALSLWRGRPLADIGSDRMRERFFAGLEEERLAALEARMDADLRLGRHAELVTELPALLAEHPLRERMRAQLMTALHHSGRRAEALRVFHEARALTVAELGVEPGQELQRLHRELLAEPRPAPAAPAPVSRNHLPRDVPDFTGRVAELTRLCAVGGQDSGVLPVWWLDGPTGVGKTALAVRAAHRLAPRYPDGQLFVELGSLGPEEVLDALLRALRVPGERIPEGLRERVALWRAELSGRRVLVVLDDAAAAGQVRPLLAGGADCLVLVTSRHRMSGLEGVRRVALDVLPPVDARELFTRLLGAERVHAETAAVAEVAQLCGYLPLAIRITGAKLAARPHWPVSRLLGRLRDEQRRLDELSVGDLAVRTGLAVSYLGLDEASRRAYRLLGALGYGNLPGWLAAPLLGEPEETAEDVLDQLVDAQLIEVSSEPAEPLRYRMHDLVRLHARERAELEDTAGERREAVRRAVTALLAAVDELAEPLPPAVPRLCHTDLSTQPRPRITGAERWFEQEEAALVAAVSRAAELDLAELAAALAEALVFSFFAVRNRYDGWARTHEAAISALRRTGHRRGEAALECSLGQLHYKRDRYELARTHFRTARALFAEVGDTRGEAVALNGIGMVGRELADHAAALPALRRARDMLATSGDEEGVAHALYGIGYAHRELGEDPEAIDTLTAAASSYRAAGNERGEALALRGIGLVHRAADRWDEAEDYCRRSHRIVSAVADDLLGCYTTQALAKVWIRQHRPEQAEAALLTAAQTSQSLHDTFGLALLHRTLGESRLAQGQVEPALRYLDLALTGWAELRLPVWRARTLRDVGAAHAAAGDEPAAHRAWREAREVFDRLGIRESAEAPHWHRRWACPCVN